MYEERNKIESSVAVVIVFLLLGAMALTLFIVDANSEISEYTKKYEPQISYEEEIISLSIVEMESIYGRYLPIPIYYICTLSDGTKIMVNYKNENMYTVGETYDFKLTTTITEKVSISGISD